MFILRTKEASQPRITVWEWNPPLAGNVESASKSWPLHFGKGQKKWKYWNLSLNPNLPLPSSLNHARHTRQLYTRFSKFHYLCKAEKALCFNAVLVSIVCKTLLTCSLQNRNVCTLTYGACLLIAPYLPWLTLCLLLLCDCWHMSLFVTFMIEPLSDLMAAISMILFHIHKTYCSWMSIFDGGNV